MQNNTERKGFTRSPGGQLVILAMAVVILYFLAYRHMRFFLVPSGSMEPTLLISDYIATFAEKEYRPGDIVVVKDPEEEGAYVVKRIVAVGPCVVAVVGGAVLVNGEYLSEPYLKDRPVYALEDTPIQAGEVFLLGDNRNQSEDSSIWKQKGQPIANVIGKVRFIYLPWHRFGVVKSYPLKPPPREMPRPQDT